MSLSECQRRGSIPTWVAHLKGNVDIGNQGRYLRYLAETETMESMAGQFRYYEPIPNGMFPDD